MTSKRSGRDLPFIKIKCDDQNKPRHSFRRDNKKTGIIFKVEEFRTTPSIQQCFKCQGFGHKAPNCTKNQNVLCVVKHILMKTALTNIKGNQNVLIVGDLMSPTTKAVLLTRIKPSGSMWSKNKFHTTQS